MMKELDITAHEIAALNRVVEDMYTNASDDNDEDEQETLELLTSLAHKLDAAFSP